MAKRRCPRCKKDKLLSAFYVIKSGPRAGRIHGWCKSCQTEAARERYQSFPEKAARRRAANRAWLAANPEKRDRWARQSWLRRRYGMTIEEYDALLASQNGACAACGGLDPNGRRLAVDHDHATNAVRGLLCDFCNRAIGLVRDDPRVADGIAAYLRAHALAS